VIQNDKVAFPDFEWRKSLGKERAVKLTGCPAELTTSWAANSSATTPASPPRVTALVFPGGGGD
jgi:hypothetical protein